MRLSIAAYILGRVLDIEGCCSVIVWVTRVIVGGSVLAKMQLRVLLLEFADALVSSSIYSKPTLYVDDATMGTICRAARICREHAKVTNTFIDARRGITTTQQLSRVSFVPSKVYVQGFYDWRTRTGAFSETEVDKLAEKLWAGVPDEFQRKFSFDKVHEKSFRLQFSTAAGKEQWFSGNTSLARLLRGASK